MTFIDELLLEAEAKEKQDRLEMNRLKADQILTALSVLEEKANDVNKLADDEIHLIEEYRNVEIQKLQKKMAWLEYNLEQFIRSTDEKTINLPHGAIKLRLGRDKVEITDMEKFMRVAPLRGLMKTVPEKQEPDLQKVLAYVKTNGFLTGVSMIPAQTKFSYILKGNGNGKQTETGDTAE